MRTLARAAALPMRLALALVLALALAGLPAAAGRPAALSCLPTACSGTWHSWGGNLTLPCSAASGHVPASGPFQLPPIFEGNFDLCRTFDEAQFCRIQTAMPLIMPISQMLPPKITGALPLGNFLLDQCVSRACPVEDIKHLVADDLRAVVDRVLSMANASAATRQRVDGVVDGLVKTVTVQCSDGAKKHMGGAAIFAVLVFCLLFTITIIATAFSVYFPDVDTPRPLNWFAADHNSSRLMAAIPGDFNVLNGVRFLSMCWVITGHSILMYAFLVRNPTAEARVLESWPFSFVRGAEFAVDSFFFMSGFLATWGMLAQFRKKTLKAKSYGMIMLGRYLRLTPSYVLVVLVYWKVFPIIGSGPSWDATVQSTNASCDSNWIYNFLYINNFFPTENAGVMGCAGWTWYLANDFQFFLLVPFVVQLFFIGRDWTGRQVTGALLKYGPVTAMVLIQLISTMAIIDDIKGGAISTDFMSRVYVKPYCRVTPYAIGIALALMHFERVEELGNGPSLEGATPWRVLAKPHIVKGTLLLSLLGLFTAITVFYTQWRCKANHHECEVWNAQYLYGFFRSPNWGKGTQVFYDSFCYLFWTVPLAAFCYILICAEHVTAHYDVFRLKWFLSHPTFTPLARLTYNAYLVHIPLQQLVFGQAKYAPVWFAPHILLEVIGYIVLAYFTALVLYLVVEKPCMNMTSHLFHVLQGGVVESPPAADDTAALRVSRHHAPLDRQLSTVSDVDSEALAMTSPPAGQIRRLSSVDDDEPAYTRLDAAAA